MSSLLKFSLDPVVSIASADCPLTGLIPPASGTALPVMVTFTLLWMPAFRAPSTLTKLLLVSLIFDFPGVLATTFSSLFLPANRLVTFTTSFLKVSLPLSAARLIFRTEVALPFAPTFTCWLFFRSRLASVAVSKDKRVLLCASARLFTFSSASAPSTSVPAYRLISWELSNLPFTSTPLLRVTRLRTLVPTVPSKPPI